MKNILEIKDLTKKYRDGNRQVTALDKVTFTLSEGEDLAILGTSGSGKTTLLQLAGGLDNRTSGEVVVNGKSLSRMNDREISDFRNRTMGFIFQMINLQTFLSAKDNIKIPALLMGVKNSEAEKRSIELLAKFGLKDRESHLPSELSGGEQQRVAVARAIINNPKIIFADEPTGRLDKENAESIIAILEELSHERGMSVVMITHDEKIAQRFSRVIRLEKGRIITDSKY